MIKMTEELKKQKKIESKKELKIDTKSKINEDNVSLKETSKKLSSKDVKISKFYDFSSIIKYPVSTEKSLKGAEFENKLVFVVDLKSKKSQIKKAVESYFNVKVKSVNTVITVKGVKKAYVTFDKSVVASDLATNMGMI